jgi:hypothetical protein
MQRRLAPYEALGVGPVGEGRVHGLRGIDAEEDVVARGVLVLCEWEWECQQSGADRSTGGLNEAAPSEAHLGGIDNVIVVSCLEALP